MFNHYPYLSISPSSLSLSLSPYSYGYAHQGYDYTPPKFMFYPYSQHDIPATESPDIYTGYSPAEYEQPRETTQPQQQQQVTSVTIEPSYSYELKPQTSYESQPQSHDAVHPAEQPQIDLPQPPPQQQHESTGPSGEDAGSYQEPVIVLRIPGPAKYAAHLQTLLQQYLEIRAAQYLQLLQEAEQRKQQQHQQQQHHLQQQQEEQLAAQPYATPEQHEQAHYHPDVSYAHQLAPTPPPVQYGPIDDVYHTYKGRHQHQQQQYEQPALPEAYYTPSAYQPQPQPQFYYAQPAQQTASYEHGYQPHVYLIAMAPQDQYEQQHQHQHLPQAQQQPIYVPEQDAPTAPAAEPATGHELPITENNPRATHTKVIFNGGGGGGGGDYAAPMYELPSIQQQYHGVAAAEQSHQPESAAHVVDAPAPDDYQPVQTSAESISSVTQPPYNYHAHGLKMPRQLRQQGKRAANAEQAADHQLQQIREYVREKLGAEMGSAVEYKTTQLLEG